MKKICAMSGEEFEVSDRDLEFLKRVSPVIKGERFLIPPPTLCPRERVRRRMAFRNERNLYHTKSTMSGESVLSMLHPDTPYPVYIKDEWMSDKWDPCSYGQEIDFSRGFFEQFDELLRRVPRVNLAVFVNNENSDYCNYVGDIKNSYLCFGSIFIEDCMYGNPYYSKNCVDCFLVRKSELCYECIDCQELYNCCYLQDCYNCSDCFYCYDLRGCQNCIGCTGLRKKSYYIFNKAYSREDYEKFMREFSFCDREKVSMVEQKMLELKREHPHRAFVTEMCENVSGNYIFNSRNCPDCFQISENEDCRFNIQTVENKDCYDMNYTEENELCYEYLGNYRNNLACFSLLPYGCHDIWYSDYLYNCKHCFGCAGLKHKEYCILNKRYSKSEYEELVPRLIKMMEKHEEWGEFFPVEISPFAFNESVASDYFPLSKEEVLKRGWKWREPDASEFKDGTYEVPLEISEVPDTVVNEVLKCEVSGRNYKITPAELKFYRRMKLPVPRRHFFERLKARLKKRLPYELFERKCDKCGIELKCAYGTEREEKVYCEKCYLEAVV